jgi:hypothetical protein
MSRRKSWDEGGGTLKMGRNDEDGCDLDTQSCKPRDHKACDLIIIPPF